jgi:hypothetical protein
MILFQNVWLRVITFFCNSNPLDHNERADANELINHPFIIKGRKLDSNKIIKELVKSKMNDLEDNRTRNFKKELDDRENQQMDQELILVDNKPKCTFYFLSNIFIYDF